MVSDLAGRFGRDFAVRGEGAPEAALTALREMAAAKEPVALLLVEEAAADFLVRAHELHPRATRLLLINRDYSVTSPAVQAMTLGRADYHIVRPWFDDETMYGAVTVPLILGGGAEAELRAVSDRRRRTMTAECCSCER